MSAPKGNIFAPDRADSDEGVRVLHLNNTVMATHSSYRHC